MKITYFALAIMASVAIAAPVEYETAANTGTDDVACWMDWEIPRVTREKLKRSFHDLFF
jgi:hypothetical protein